MQKATKTRTRQDRPTNKEFIGMLGIPQWKFYTLMKKGVITKDMTLKDMQKSIEIGKPFRFEVENNRGMHKQETISVKTQDAKHLEDELLDGLREVTDIAVRLAARIKKLREATV